MRFGQGKAGADRKVEASWFMSQSGEAGSDLLSGAS